MTLSLPAVRLAPLQTPLPADAYPADRLAWHVYALSADYRALSPRARGTLGVLHAASSMGTGTTWRYVESIAERLGCSHRTAQRGLAELVRAGFAARRPRYLVRGGWETSSLWTLLRPPCLRSAGQLEPTEDLAELAEDPIAEERPRIGLPVGGDTGVTPYEIPALSSSATSPPTPPARRRGGSKAEVRILAAELRPAMVTALEEDPAAVREIAEGRRPELAPYWRELLTRPRWRGVQLVHPILPGRIRSWRAAGQLVAAELLAAEPAELGHHASPQAVRPDELTVEELRQLRVAGYDPDQMLEDLVSPVLRAAERVLDDPALRQDAITDPIVRAVAERVTRDARDGLPGSEPWRHTRPRYADVARILRRYASPGPELAEGVRRVERVDDPDVAGGRARRGVPDVPRDRVEVDPGAAELGHDAGAQGVCADALTVEELRQLRAAGYDPEDRARRQAPADPPPAVDGAEHRSVDEPGLRAAHAVEPRSHRTDGADAHVRVERHADDSPDAELIALAAPDGDGQVRRDPAEVGDVEGDELAPPEPRRPAEREERRVSAPVMSGLAGADHRRELDAEDRPARSSRGDPLAPADLGEHGADGGISAGIRGSPLAVEPGEGGQVEADRAGRSALDELRREVARDGPRRHGESGLAVRASPGGECTGGGLVFAARAIGEAAGELELSNQQIEAVDEVGRRPGRELGVGRPS